MGRGEMVGYWYFAESTENIGPIAWPQLRDLLRSGRISQSTLVWQEGMSDWISMAAALRSMEPEPPREFQPQFPAHAENKADAEPAQPVITDAKGWYSFPVHPWRRYLARALDISFQGLLGVLVLAYVWYSVAPLSADAFFTFLSEHKSGRLADIVLTTFIAAVLGSIFIGVTGTSLGKIMFGIKVVDPDFKVIGIGRALGREFEVWGRGLAFGIPLIAVFTLIFSYRRLTREGSTSWDKDRYTVLYRPLGGLNAALCILGFVLICALNALFRYLETL
jgi:hypothetical protein